MAVLETHSQDISVLVGQELYVPLQCFQDDALSIPFDLTGYVLQAVLKPPSNSSTPTVVTLTTGSGLTVVASSGQITLQTPTTGWNVGRGRWYLQATDPAGLVSYPLRGVLFTGNP